MANIERAFALACNSWDKWNKTDVLQRISQLRDAIDLLPDSDKLAAQFQLDHSSEVVSKVHHLVGPTGETNELYTSGRGTALLVIDSTDRTVSASAFAMLTSLLVAGNSVIICSDFNDHHSHRAFEQVSASLPEHLVQLMPLTDHNKLITKDIRIFAYIGNAQAEREINRQLALRAGAIVALVSETDLIRLPQSQNPKLVLRFITERTRTINITAVGGNATLLEISSERR